MQTVHMAIGYVAVLFNIFKQQSSQWTTYIKTKCSFRNSPRILTESNIEYLRNIWPFAACFKALAFPWWVFIKYDSAYLIQHA